MDTERREGWVDVADPPMRVGFTLLAGVPLRVECALVNRGDRPMYLAVVAHRMAHRWADVSFEAVLEGEPLPDPAAGAPDLGGPATDVLLHPGESNRQTETLADYVLLPESPRGRLDLRCRRRVGLDADDVVAFTKPPVEVTVDLVVVL